MSKVIVFATPVFLLLIALEFAWGRRLQRLGAPHDTYRFNDTLNSIGLGIMGQLSGIVTRALQVGFYVVVFQAVARFSDGATAAGGPIFQFWSTWYGIVLALIFYDFCYYWLHRAGHEIALFWAAHVVHHQSQSYNLSTALRQTSSGSLFGWIFYLPMALAGVPPVIFGTVALIDLLYQFWVHTEHIGKLGWFDRWFCAPSNHRVHHAVNDHYLDKNYGGILMLWDRLFGTYKVEDVPCIYGTRSALDSCDPLWANAEVYWSLAKDSWHSPRWADKLRVWLKPPGWRAPGLAERWPKPAFDLARVTTYNPPMGTGVMWFCAAQFALLLAGVAGFLWVADGLPLAQAALGCVALSTGLWALGAVVQGRLTPLAMLMIEAAVVATTSSVLGLTDLHWVFKPLTLVIAIKYVANYVQMTGTTGLNDQKSRLSGHLTALLAMALLASLIGDVFLMVPGNFFIAGLASFLVAHGFYIMLFKGHTPGGQWFPSRKAWVGTLAVGSAMYAYIYPGLHDPVLKVAVAAYVLVIALMAAQAMGRAVLLAQPASVAVAIGAGLFMLSDSLIAINRFVQPLPMSPLWVLSTYYAAQMLIVHNMTFGMAREQRPAPMRDDNAPNFSTPST